jgi:hypothetical protein
MTAFFFFSFRQETHEIGVGVYWRGKFFVFVNFRYRFHGTDANNLWYTFASMNVRLYTSVDTKTKMKLSALQLLLKMFTNVMNVKLNTTKDNFRLFKMPPHPLSTKDNFRLFKILPNALSTWTQFNNRHGPRSESRAAIVIITDVFRASSSVPPGYCLDRLSWNADATSVQSLRPRIWICQQDNRNICSFNVVTHSHTQTSPVSQWSCTVGCVQLASGVPRYVAAVGTAWALLGSLWKGQLSFKKYLFSLQYIRCGTATKTWKRLGDACAVLHPRARNQQVVVITQYRAWHTYPRMMPLQD